MSDPYSIGDAIDELYDVAAIAKAAMSMHEPGSTDSRVQDVLIETLNAIINRLDALETSMRNGGAE